MKPKELMFPDLIWYCFGGSGPRGGEFITHAKIGKAFRKIFPYQFKV